MRWVSLALCVLVCLGVSALGALATDSDPGSWYEGIEKAPWNPPSWVFGPVWTVLYISIGVALWIIWRSRPSPRRSRALTIFAVQLLLNLAWSWLFFGLEQPLLALVDLAFLVGALVVLLRVAWWETPIASLIMLPYLLWCSFAVTLNGAVVLLN
jgi:benzodiazapine receptor